MPSAVPPSFGDAALVTDGLGSVSPPRADRRCPVSLALCAGAYWRLRPWPLRVRSGGSRVHSLVVVVPARTSRRVSGSTCDGYSSRSQPVLRDVAGSMGGSPREPVKRLALDRGRARSQRSDGEHRVARGSGLVARALAQDERRCRGRSTTGRAWPHVAHRPAHGGIDVRDSRRGVMSAEPSRPAVSARTPGAADRPPATSQPSRRRATGIHASAPARLRRRPRAR